MEIPKRKLGKTGVDVTILGLGGEGVLRTYGYERAAYDLINQAIDLGINYFESARAYSGSESYYGRSYGRGGRRFSSPANPMREAKKAHCSIFRKRSGT